MAFTTVVFLCNNHIKVLHVSTFTFPVSSLSPGQFPWINRHVFFLPEHALNRREVYPPEIVLQMKKKEKKDCPLPQFWGKKWLIASSFKDVLRDRMPRWGRNLIIFLCSAILGLKEALQTPCVRYYPFSTCKYLHIDP